MSLAEWRQVLAAHPTTKWYRVICLDCAAELDADADQYDKSLCMQEAIDKLGVVLEAWGPECLAECVDAAITEMARRMAEKGAGT